MEKVYQVFVSSTYADLADERRRVSESLAKAGFIPAGMELFPAADQQQLELIKRVIDRCDYYVVIVGGRYGSLADKNVSYTEKEYEYAISKNITVLAFLHEKPEKIEVGKTDQSSKKAKKLKAFRDRLATGRMVDFWSDAHELCKNVVIAVVNSVTMSPGIGWVRGDQTIDPKVLQETERLRIENKELKKQLNELSFDEIVFSKNIAGPTDKIKLSLIQARITNDGKPNRLPDKEVEVTLAELFFEIYDSLLKNPPEKILGGLIGNKLMQIAGIASDGKIIASISPKIVKKLRFQYEALDLIKASGDSIRDYGFSDQSIKWSVTDKGRRYVAQSMAFPSPSKI